VPSDPDAESLSSFLSDHTGISVKIVRSQILAYITMLVLFGIMAALVQPIINSLDFWLRIIRAKPLWMLVSAGVYTCAISGMIFDIIRSPPM
jgi:predicted neutral ceramidase superfamily lipid hydrolase